MTSRATVGFWNFCSNFGELIFIDLVAFFFFFVVVVFFKSLSYTDTDSYSNVLCNFWSFYTNKPQVNA